MKPKIKDDYTKREVDDMLRNHTSMNSKNQQKVAAIILFAIFPKIIKGKLGFNLSTSDTLFLSKAEDIYNAFTDDVSGYFAVAFVHLALLHTQTGDYDTAIQNIGKAIPGAVGAKNTAKSNLMNTLKLALAYVNALALASQATAEAIITGAKMIVVKSKVLSKKDFKVKKAGAGQMLLRTLAGRLDGKLVKTFYEWQYSLDNGVTWIDLPSSTVAKLLATGLPSGVAILFRKRLTTPKGGTTQWSDPETGTPA